MQVDAISFSQVSMQRTGGEGRLRVAALDGRTRIARLYQQGASKIRVPRAARPDLEAVLINTSGGMTGGDRIEWSMEAGPDTYLTLTSQACEKIYRSAEGKARVSVRLAAASGARIDWLPQETILFDNSALHRRLDVHLEQDAELLIVEPVILGRTGMGERVSATRFHDRWRIHRDGRLIQAEDTRLEGDIIPMASRSAVLGGAIAFATLFYAGHRAGRLAEGLRKSLSGPCQGVSCWDNKLMVRLVAADGLALRRALVPLLAAVRTVPLPRIWNT